MPTFQVEAFEDGYILTLRLPGNPVRFFSTLEECLQFVAEELSA
jgi:hypothetical protein